jgi:hypothetical protein
MAPRRRGRQGVLARAIAMTRVLPDFERRVRLALAHETPVLPLEDLITDGCAAALHLETHLARLERRRDALLPLVGRDDDAARETVEIAGRIRETGDDLDQVRDLLSELMHLRARTRLRAFLAEPRPAT